MHNRVTIFEMAPRDGLQNEEKQIPTRDKIQLVDALSECGFSKIEVTSFVSPKWVPQLADAAAVMAGIARKPGVRYTALTPNMRGFDAAKTSRADEIAIFASASEGFSQKNINCSIAESLERFQPVMEAAAAEKIPVRGYVSCVVACPYDGPIAPGNVAYVASKLEAMGCYQVSLGDTIGAGIPASILSMLDAVLAVVPAERLAGHYHDTGRKALANIKVSLQQGIRTFDSSIAGLGGCPFAPGAQGNVSTESVVSMLHDEGYQTGIDPDCLKEVVPFARSVVGRS